MPKQTQTLKLSKTSIERYMQCPMLWYFSYVEKLPSRTDYPRLCGVQVHRFIAGLYKEHPSNRRFWYQNLNTARKAWIYTWKRALEENRSLILNPDIEMEKKYAGIGCMCIQNYWNQNIGEDNDPISIEKQFTIPLDYPNLKGVSLSGVFDQIRTVNLSWLNKRRPEIFAGEKLLPTYDPVLIVDLKTGWSDFDISDDDSDLVKVRKQFEIQLGIQGAAYSLLYKKVFGKFPAGFLIYPLRLDKKQSIFIKGDEEGPQTVLRENVFHIVENIRNRSFPRNVTANCRRCDFYMECRPNGAMNVSLPDAIPKSISPPEEAHSEKIIQMKLPFGKAKRK